MRNLTKTSVVAALVGAFALAPAAQARTVYGTVVDVDPVRAGAPRQVCESSRGDGYYDDRRYDRQGYQDNNRVGGSVAGAVIGGAVGNQFGDGNGRTAATVAGAVLGGLAGREIQGRHQDRDRYENRDDDRYDNRYRDDRYGRRCWTEYEGNGRVTSYNVTYRAEGRTYTTRMNYAPRVGSRIRVDTSW